MPLDFTGWHIMGSSVTLLFLFSNLLLSIFYCIPEYCRLKYFLINLPPVDRVDSALSWGCPVAAACATSQGRWAQVESLGDWLQLPGVFLSVTMQDGLYCEAELHLQACFCSEKQGRGWWATFPHGDSSVQSWVWQMLSAAPDKTSPILELQSIVL